MCGITAFYPKKRQKADFNILKGVAAINDERGKDNSGISIGDIFYERCDTNKYIRDLIAKFKTTISELNLVDQPWIMHTRSSSNKLKQKATHAHPFHWFYRGDNDEKVNYFYGCHNGFISNTIDLHKKYLLDTGMRKNTSYQYDVDSEVILDAICCNIEDEQTVCDILKDYTGNAALVFYRKDEFYAWKGASNNTEERPLYYVETKAGWYFSSIEASLSMYFDNVKLVPHNTLLIFRDGKFVKEILIPRKFVAKTVHFGHSANMNMAHLSAEGGRTTAKAATPIWTFISDVGQWCFYGGTGVTKTKEPLEGHFWIDDPIVDSCIYTAYSSKADSPIHFYKGVAMRKDNPAAQVAISLLQTATTEEGITNVFDMCKDEIKDFIVAFVPFYIKNVLSGFIVNIDGEPTIVPKGKKYVIDNFGKRVSLSLKPVPRVYATPIEITV